MRFFKRKRVSYEDEAIEQRHAEALRTIALATERARRDFASRRPARPATLFDSPAVPTYLYRHFDRGDTASSEGLPPASHPQRSIAKHVRREVWRRDQARCVDCGSQERLEYDHIVPVSRGGSNTVRNIELRCETCNRRKGARV